MILGERETRRWDTAFSGIKTSSTLQFFRLVKQNQMIKWYDKSMVIIWGHFTHGNTDVLLRSGDRLYWPQQGVRRHYSPQMMINWPKQGRHRMDIAVQWHHSHQQMIYWPKQGVMEGGGKKLTKIGIKRGGPPFILGITGTHCFDDPLCIFQPGAS